MSVSPFATLLRRFRRTKSSLRFVRTNKEGLVESHATETAPQHRIEGVPVRYVVVGD
jgi:hypothetical protein